MPLLARTVTTPLTIDVRRGAIGELGAILADRRISTGGEVAIVVGPGQGERVVELIRPSLRGADVFTVAGGTVDAAVELGTRLRSRSYDAVVGIGGGRTIDTAKYAATRYGLPMVSVATSLAHDGIASPVSILDHEGRRGSYGVHIPIAVVVDLDFIDRHSPAPGIGELASNISALADWELARSVRGEPVDGLAVSMARTAALAVVHHPGTMADDEFVTLLADGLIMSGVAMTVCGSTRPCSGGCHEISHAIDLLYPGTAAHGDQVGLGALFCTYLRGDLDRFALLRDCLSRHGLPTLPVHIGLSRDRFVAAVLRAPTTRPDRFTILEHLSLDEPGTRTALTGYEAALAEH